MLFRSGGAFDCYLAEPAGSAKVPAVVLASAIHGVDEEIRAIADEFAAAGYLAAAPDLFWRTETPGPLQRDDPRAALGSAVAPTARRRAEVADRLTRRRLPTEDRVRLLDLEVGA